jgi:RNA polymerase sigma-70 factor (ECF subfamily)
MSDLLHRIATDRDRAAFGELFAAFAPRIKGMLMRQGADSHTAEEIAQEAMLAVWRKAHLYSPERGGVATWIFTISRNLRIDRLRREIPFQQLVGEDNQQDEEPLPDENLGSRQIQERMRAVLRLLPADQVEVVRLAYLDGLSHSQIADRLRLPLGTVKSRIRLAYQKIRDAFEANS